MGRHRKLTQFLSLLIGNLYLLPWRESPIFQGATKRICFPGLNCYSCPAATMSCPLGGLQNALADFRANLMLGVFHPGAYIIGTLGLIGSVLGRIPCGWLCPFGLFQEILFASPFKKIALPRFLRYGPFFFLIFFVILFPLLLVDSLGYGQTFFCKYVCPAGTFEAGIPLSIMEKDIRGAIGLLFYYKFTLLIAIVLWCLVTSRAFCRSICPLGAIFGLFNKISMVKLHFNKDNCVECSACRRICPTGISFFDNVDNINSPACIRCMKCYKICPTHSINLVFEPILKENKENFQEN